MMLNKHSLPRPKRRVPPPEREIVVRGEYITLGQLLKTADIISTGGEAKPYLAETIVYVNGEPEQRRGRKLRPGDRIEAPDAPPVRLIAAPVGETREEMPATPAAPTTRQKQKAAFANDATPRPQENAAALRPQENAGDV